MPLQFDDIDNSKSLKDYREGEAERLAKTLSEMHGVGYANLSGIPVEADALKLIPEIDARAWNVAPFQIAGKNVKVAVHSPNNENTVRAIKNLSEQGFEVEIFMSSIKSLEKAWSRYEDITETQVHKAGVVDVGKDNISSIQLLNETSALTRTRLEGEFKASRPVSELITLLLESSIAEGASDIHIEPQEADVQFRLRIDGVLVPLLNFDHDIYKRVVSRIKILSGLKINIVSEPQDGRFSIDAEDSEVEVRVSLIPGAFGESVVMRLLNPEAANVTIEKLGIDKPLNERIMIELSKPNGLILTTGPTGSGKTTALYAFLKQIYEPGIKIITIENPVEYRLNGVVQTQVNKEKGYDFYDGLTSSLRQDPDVIMVGEIRDDNTAKTAVQAALTGHLVFSTLHTNDAAGAIPRMRDLGVKEDVLGSALSLILAQRLVRKLKPGSKEERPMTDREKALIPAMMSDVDEARWKHLFDRGTLFEPSDRSNDHASYSGRIGIFEGIVVNDEVEELIRNNTSTHEIDLKGRKPYNILSLRQHGLLNVLEGITDLNELERIVSLS